MVAGTKFHRDSQKRALVDGQESKATPTRRSSAEQYLSAYKKSGTFTNTCGDLQRLKKAAEVVGPKSDLEIIARIARHMVVQSKSWSRAEKDKRLSRSNPGPRIGAMALLVTLLGPAAASTLIGSGPPSFRVTSRLCKLAVRKGDAGRHAGSPTAVIIADRLAVAGPPGRTPRALRGSAILICDIPQAPVAGSSSRWSTATVRSPYD